MVDVPHPFELQPQAHYGWTRKHFEHQGRQWYLLTIEQPGKVKSQMGPMDNDKRPPWPSYHNLVLDDVVLTVDAAARIISMVYMAFTEGLLEGGATAKAEIRRVLGCRS